MDRIEAFTYTHLEPAEEGILGTATVAVIAMAITAIAATSMKAKREEKTIRKYKEAKASGDTKALDKMKDKMTKIQRFGMPYEEYEQKIAPAAQHQAFVHQLCDKYYKQIQADVAYLIKDEKYKGFVNVINKPVDWDYDDIGYPPYTEAHVCTMLNLDDVIACMDDIDPEKLENFSNIEKYGVSRLMDKSDIDTVKSMSVKLLREGFAKVQKMVESRLREMAAELKEKGLPVTGFNVESNPDEVYKYYGVTFKNLLRK